MTNPAGHTKAGVSTPVTLINAFSVPMAQGEQFLSRWKENASHMVNAPGLIRARMYQAISDRAELTFVNVAEWETGTALDEARRNPEWQAAVRRVIEDPELDVVTRPMVYELAIDVAPGNPPL